MHCVMLLRECECSCESGSLFILRPTVLWLEGGAQLGLIPHLLTSDKAQTQVKLLLQVCKKFSPFPFSVFLKDGQPKQMFPPVQFNLNI